MRVNKILAKDKTGMWQIKIGDMIVERLKRFPNSRQTQPGLQLILNRRDYCQPLVLIAFAGRRAESPEALSTTMHCLYFKLALHV